MRFCKIFWIVSLTCSHLFAATCEFQFVDQKENGLSEEFLQKIVQTFHPSVFFETGTYDGQTALNASKFFDQVITVEIYPPIFEQLKPKFSSHSNIESYLGNSSELIEKIGKNLQGTILFWLDAHYSGEGTGMTGSANSGSAQAITPIREELKAIYEAQIKDCIILIDDIRGFGTEIQNHIFLGCWAYPTVQEIQAALLKINPQFKIALLGDMLLAYDGSKYSPCFSPLVTACTKTRLYDGYNLSEKELFELGRIIQKVPQREAEYIKKLYNTMAVYNDAMFWHDIWYGLIQLGQKNLAQAKNLFQKASLRIQSATCEDEAKKVIQLLQPVWKDLIDDDS